MHASPTSCIQVCHVIVYTHVHVCTVPTYDMNHQLIVFGGEYLVYTCTYTCRWDTLRMSYSALSLPSPSPLPLPPSPPSPSYSYVGLMCNVKSERQYYHQQDVIVLFCESTLRWEETARLHCPVYRRIDATHDQLQWYFTSHYVCSSLSSHRVLLRTHTHYSDV